MEGVGYVLVHVFLRQLVDDAWSFIASSRILELGDDGDLLLDLRLLRDLILQMFEVDTVVTMINDDDVSVPRLDIDHIDGCVHELMLQFGESESPIETILILLIDDDVVDKVLPELAP